MSVSDVLRRLLRRLARPIAARRVMVANGRSKAAFRARIVGEFKRSGPNAWDDYRLDPTEGNDFEVLPGVKLQVEQHGAVFRIRHHGTVVLAQWRPEPDEIQSDDPEERRAAFLARCVGAFGHAKGLGAAAVVARTLRK